MLTRFTTLAAAALLTAGVYSVPAFAASDDSTSTTVPSCKSGKVWDKKKKKCVKPMKKSGLSDDNLYEAAKDLAYNQRYDEAIHVLKLAQNQNDPRILNYLGYATRKSGDVLGGLAYYQAALKIDPNYNLVREYLGEAYLQLGMTDKAKEQLAELEQRCGVDCREYAMLAERIDATVQ